LEFPMRVRLAVLLAVAGMLLLAVVVARGSSGIPVGQGVFTGFESGGWSSSAIEAPPVSSPPIAIGLGILLVLVGILALFTIAALLVAMVGWRRWRMRRGMRLALSASDEVEPGQVWLARATRRAMSEMDRRVGGPPSDAVVAAWVQLEEAAAAKGTERKPHQTPTEFAERLLDDLVNDGDALRELKTLYHRARFGRPGSVTDRDAAAARSALERIAS
jgi:hypothetical protein